MKLLFLDAPFDSGFIYGRWEDGPNGMSYYTVASLDGTEQDLREILEKEEGHAYRNNAR